MSTRTHLIRALKDCVSALEYAADDLEILKRPKAAIACRTRADAALALINTCHTVKCYEETDGTRGGNSFWVCKPGCAVGDE